MSKALTPPEIADLERLEKVVERGKQTFVEVGLALAEIRERKLYRRDYDTFEAYCQDRWGWTRVRAHQLIQAAQVVEALPSECKPVVNTERAARELGKLPVPEQTRVVKEAQKNGDSVAAIVRRHFPPPPQVNAKRLPPPTVVAKKASAPEVRRCHTGWEIPAAILPLWERAEEVQGLLSGLSTLRGILRKAEEEKDKVFAEVNFSSIKAHLDQVYADLKTAKPFAVCPTCLGKTPDNCALCKGRGFISEHLWGVVPVEVKEMRKKLICGIAGDSRA